MSEITESLETQAPVDLRRLFMGAWLRVNGTDIDPFVIVPGLHEEAGNMFAVEIAARLSNDDEKPRAVTLLSRGESRFEVYFEADGYDPEPPEDKEDYIHWERYNIEFDGRIEAEHDWSLKGRFGHSGREFEIQQIREATPDEKVRLAGLLGVVALGEFRFDNSQHYVHTALCITGPYREDGWMRASELAAELASDTQG